MKSIQIRSFFRSVFSRIWTEYGEIRVVLRIQFESGKIQTRKNSVFGHFSRSLISCISGRYKHCQIRQILHKYKYCFESYCYGSFFFEIWACMCNREYKKLSALHQALLFIVFLEDGFMRCLLFNGSIGNWIRWRKEKFWRKKKKRSRKEWLKTLGRRGNISFNNFSACCYLFSKICLLLLFIILAIRKFPR